MLLFAEASFYCSFEGMAGLNVTDVRRERIPLVWSTVRESRPMDFVGTWETQSIQVFCRRTKLSGRGVHGKKARELSRKHTNEHTVIHLAESTHTNTCIYTHIQTKLHCIGKYPTTKRNNKKGGFHGLQKGWSQ